MTISQAANYLGVSTKTMMRWDADGVIPAQRDPITNSRLYHPIVLEKVKKWLDLRKRHKDLLNKLGPIRARIDKFLAIKPLDPYSPTRPVKFEEMKAAFEDMGVWKKKHDEIYKEYADFTEGFYGKLKE